MLDLLEHATFVVCVLDLLHLDNLSLFEHLYGVETLIVLGLDEMHAAKAAGAESALYGKVLEGVFALCRAHGVGLMYLGDGAILGLVPGGEAGGGGIRRVDQILDAGDIVLGLLIWLGGGLRSRIGLLWERRVIHRIGWLVGRVGGGRLLRVLRLL